MEKGQEPLGQERILQIRFRWSAGPYLGRFLTELKENGRLWAVRCPGCHRALMPPRIVCAVCYTKTPEFPQGWFTLSGKGKLMDWERVIYPQMDPETGQTRPEPYLHGTFLLDGEVQFTHYLGPEDLDEAMVTAGMDVEMVLRPPEERKGLPTDIIYFRITEGPHV
ncbi:MAG: Zn-ribbon domain-containing OB-fold protein [Thermodesulfobacteriota bacterium]